ncbi:hypothetical protein HBH56_217610 [Parastagonospora nodorum]|nr:hypothetical protein HBH56_217610 [Parastagonospora nodorum]KAH3922722.1 hypothetical protein HBH54_219470 [Parastagonospora nodorum]KAH4043630.1 hypothetical protein HBH49_229180 [Parastagonospora nodorum]KAH4058981.1 hypothetical protein HBH50_230370 [Parastagonospora nodorum]KAH4079137.1 hypothetical protein HBH48_223830 [Parastagonospora nodorum]
MHSHKPHIHFDSASASASATIKQQPQSTPPTQLSTSLQHPILVSELSCLRQLLRNCAVPKFFTRALHVTKDIMADEEPHANSLLTLPVELRLQIYSYLIPLDTEHTHLCGLVMSCRTIKYELYDDMRNYIQKIRALLDARWPFDKPFNIPFPGLAFKSKQLLIEVPYYSSGRTHNIEFREEKVRLHDFVSQGAFDLGVKRVVLHVKAFDVQHTDAPIPYYRVPPPRPGERVEKKEASHLMKMYLRLAMEGAFLRAQPEEMSVVLFRREYASCPDTLVSRVVELVRGPNERLWLTESLNEPEYAGRWPVIGI